MLPPPSCQRRDQRFLHRWVNHRLLLRLLTPIAKLLTAKQTVKVVSQCSECSGSAGYVEATSVPVPSPAPQKIPSVCSNE
jgi:hypothetical protein